MEKVERTTVYFRKTGESNTEHVIRAVRSRLEEGDLKAVIVASTSGATGLKFAESLKGKAQILAVSHEKMEPSLKKKIESSGGKAIDQTHLPLHGEGMDATRGTLYALGQGFKVAVEVILIATDKDLVKPFADVVGVGGTGTGADTAIVARSTRTSEAFGDDREKKLEIREIIAMPLTKTWW